MLRESNGSIEKPLKVCEYVTLQIRSPVTIFHRIKLFGECNTKRKSRLVSSQGNQVRPENFQRKKAKQQDKHQLFSLTNSSRSNALISHLTIEPSKNQEIYINIHSFKVDLVK